jgi:hypothetical protein
MVEQCLESSILASHPLFFCELAVDRWLISPYAFARIPLLFACYADIHAVTAAL